MAELTVNSLLQGGIILLPPGEYAFWNSDCTAWEKKLNKSIQILNHYRVLNSTWEFKCAIKKTQLLKFAMLSKIIKNIQWNEVPTCPRTGRNSLTHTIEEKWESENRGQLPVCWHTAWRGVSWGLCLWRVLPGARDYWATGSPAVPTPEPSALHTQAGPGRPGPGTRHSEGKHTAQRFRLSSYPLPSC